jgi:hypothetical protein
MDLFINCPHCNNYFVVNVKDINCAIFRHAVYKNNNQPINPHESKVNCDNLVALDLVYGCAKPFRIKMHNNNYITEICDYI